MSKAARASVHGIPTWLADAPLVLRMGVAVALGAIGALGQAPFDWPLALIVALACAFALWRAQPTPAAAGAIGWAFGLGYFGLALLWIVEPFQVDAGRHGWMAPFALLFLSSGLALFWGMAFRVARWLSPAAIGLALVWTGAEMLRAYVLTGFPWASPAQVLVEGPASRLLAFGGPHGATLVLMLLAWSLSLPAIGAGAGGQRLGRVALLAAAAFALHLPLARPDAPGTGQIVRLVQPNAEQHLKWLPENAEVFYSRQLSLTAETAAVPPDLVVWPETAIPWRLQTAGSVLRQISETAGGVPVALGALRDAQDGVRNSLAVLDGQGQPAQVYDKHHLVPFGEYIPLLSWAERFGFTGLAANGAGFSRGSGPQLLDFGALGKALPLICYEAVFAHQVARAPGRPAFLLQVTNDAWFGDFAGPQQHLAQARMRAIEQGLPMVRAANTGISAMIDPLGRITAFLPLGVAGVVDAELPAAHNPTLYARIGDWPVIWLLLFGLVAQHFRRRRRAGKE